MIVVLDSLGVGELPDAREFGDEGANTLKHTDQKLKGLKTPHLDKLGLHQLLGETQVPASRAYFGRMIEISRGKDTTTGHWEMMGLPLHVPMATFPQGFSQELLTEWSKRTSCQYLGNKPASGTAIIDELGAEHLKTLAPIVYTSADSVFQIAAHEEAFGLDRLYKICEITRQLLDETEFKVGRVIARPFLGQPGSFKRTGNRRDFSITPPGRTALDALKDKGIRVLGVGKIPYIFGFQGITDSLEAHNDQEACEATLNALEKLSEPGVIFTNLNDLDMIYGHRRDAEGYGRHLEWIDSQIGKIVSALQSGDLLVITADHGNDPTYKGTDHTREFVPLLLASPDFAEHPTSRQRLSDRESFADLGQSLVDNFGLTPWPCGKSFLKEL